MPERSLSIVFGTPTTGKRVLAIEASGHAERVLAADRDERVELLLARSASSTASHAAVDLVRFGARRSEDRPAARKNPGHLATPEWGEDSFG